MNYDKNSKSIVIPDGVKSISDEMFMDYDNLEEVFIPDSVTYIGKAAFKGCKNLKRVRLSNNLNILDSFAFSECESLESIIIPSSLHYFSYGVFSHSYNLKTIKVHDNINYIDDYAFLNCKSLKFNTPLNVKSIGRMAFMGCDSIYEINIPKSVDSIEVGAFSLMSSLEKIIVDEENKKYFSLNDNTILADKDGVILQYAINNPSEELTIGYYIESFGNLDEDTILSNSLIYNILDYAFAGAINLRKIFINSELESIGTNTFLGCDNLKDLEVFHSSHGDVFLMRVNKLMDEDAFIPFENIVIGEGIKDLCGKMSLLFKNAREVTLPNSLESISEDVFTESKYLKNIVIPSRVKMISPGTFYPETKLNFQNEGTLMAKDFSMLQTKTSDYYFIKCHDKDNIRIFSLSDGTYYVKIDDYDTIRVKRDEIINLSKSSNVMADSPDDFIMYLINLLSVNVESERLLSNILIDPKLKEIFNNFANDSIYLEDIARKKTSCVIREILDNSGVYDEFLFSGVMMKMFGKNELVNIVSNYNSSINRFFRLSKSDVDMFNSINIDSLISYTNLLEKYKRYDRFFYNPVLVKKLSYKNQELLIKYFDKNIKHLLVNSQTLNDSYGNNLNDLLNLCNSVGVFSNDEILRQRMSTFLNEKVVSKSCNYPIVGNDIHTIFGEINPRENVDLEFIMFFVENYDKLILLEKNNSGIISRIYNSFRDISKTSTSHRGSQRHLKVTIDKCMDYFLTERFEGVTEENKKLATLLQKYYSESYALGVSEMIVNQSKNAPRNVFSKISYIDGEIVYSYDSDEDLVEFNKDDFSYHWLPKQDYDNLILGKYCSCCAHILGNGAGIMRASMILDNCQNLVIRNKKNEIIAKMTIYVNREKGYAVFNTAEVNINYHNKNSLDGIYKAFMRGVNAFVNRYNKNNVIPISIVTIGEYRNNIKYNLGNIETELFETPNYSSYGYYVGDKSIGTYDGDSKKKQILVLKK